RLLQCFSSIRTPVYAGCRVRASWSSPGAPGSPLPPGAGTPTRESLLSRRAEMTRSRLNLNDALVPDQVGIFLSLEYTAPWRKKTLKRPLMRSHLRIGKAVAA